jgi:hypothetical protein
MEDQPQQLSRGDEYLNSALIEYETLQQNEALHRALAMHRAYLEEQKILYRPQLDTSIVELQCALTYMEAQLQLIMQIQEILTPTNPTSE